MPAYKISLGINYITKQMCFLKILSLYIHSSTQNTENMEI